MLTLARKFYSYQKERFPVALLLVGLLPSILSSGVVVGSVSVVAITGALIFSLFFLLHVRIIDEYRDYGHDVIHHPDRPIARGDISLKQLAYVDAVAIFFMITLSAMVSLVALYATVGLLTYTFFAWKEFFLYERLRKRFFIYNGINLLQIFFLQVTVYLLLVGIHPFVISELLVIHAIYLFVGTVIVEFLRKVYVQGKDGTGKDTYTSFLGFKKCLAIYGGMLTLHVGLFVLLFSIVGTYEFFRTVIAVLVVLLAWGALVLNYIKQSEKTNQFMQLQFMSTYGVCNIILFTSIWL